MAASSNKSVRITPAFFYLLLSLSEGEQHGYAMARQVEELSSGEIVLPPGSVYWSLSRLAEAGLITETDGPVDEPHAERRKYYRLTDLGRERLRQHAETLAGALERARLNGVL